MTKYAHFFAVTSTISASEVASLFFKDIFRLHGFPRIIINDRDSKFTSAFWQTLFDLVGTNMNMSTSYHPHKHGKNERVNQWLEGYLCNYVTGQQGAWATWLHLGEFYYNTTFHLSIRMTPFMALYGYEAPTFSELIFGYCKAQKDKDWLQENQDILRALKGNLQMAQNQQNMYTDKHRIDIVFQVEDLVYLRLQHYRQSSLNKKGAEKI